MNLFLSATTVGLILALLALGVVASYGVLRIVDLTVDGAFTTGAAIAGLLLVRGAPASLATLAGAAGGFACGLVTGFCQTRLGVPQLLAGMITTTALYSVDILLMGGGNLSLAAPETVFETAAGLIPGVPAPVVVLGAILILVAAMVAALWWFFRTDLGLALLAVGSSPVMADSVGISTPSMTVFGLGLGNGLVALSGALFAQYEGFANVQMGLGMLVTGLAAVVLGGALLGKRGIGRRLTGAVAGAVAFQYIVAGALRAGLDANALKLLTAVFLLLVLVAPAAIRRLRFGGSGG